MGEVVKRVFDPEIKAKLKGLGGFNKTDYLEIVPSAYKEKVLIPDIGTDGIQKTDEKENLLFKPSDENKIPKEYWPIFKFKYLNSSRLLELQSLVSKINMDEIEYSALSELFAQACSLIDKTIIEVKNFYNIETGEEIIIKDRESIDYLDVALITDLLVQLVTQNKLSDEEREGLI